MDPIEIPGLGEAERAFQVDGGEIVVVRITRHKTPDDRFIGLKVESWLATEEGDVVQIGGAPARPPASVRTVLVDALSSGALTIQGVMADATVEAVDKALRHAAAMRAWAMIPSDDADANGNGEAESDSGSAA